MPEKTQTWVSKADRSKKITVKVPFYGLAQTTDGKTIPRDQLQLEFEPELAPVEATAVGAAPAVSDDRIERVMQQIGVLTEQVRGAAWKIAEVHAVVVPQPAKGQTGS